MSERIAVLFGGHSAEREVSLTSGKACAEALAARGYDVQPLDPAKGNLAERLRAYCPDVAFNALHGRFGEDGCVQGLLEVLRIPYTHSGVRASSAAMHKPTAIRLFKSAGLRCPDGVLATRNAILTGGVMPLPFVVKPSAEGSSVGVLIVQSLDDPRLRANTVPGAPGAPIEDEPPLLVEPYIPGAELTVVVLDGEPMTVTEIRPSDGFYDYRAKYSAGFADHLLPAPVPDDVFQLAMESAATAHGVLGCRGVSRADFRFDPTRGTDGLYLLEVNTQPGMTPLSLAPEQAAHCGLSFADLVVRLVEDASCDR